MMILAMGCFEIEPHNNLHDCSTQCEDSKKSKACNDFCNCIHEDGRPLNDCLDAYNNAQADSILAPPN